MRKNSITLLLCALIIILKFFCSIPSARAEFAFGRYPDVNISSLPFAHNHPNENGQRFGKLIIEKIVSITAGDIVKRQTKTREILAKISFKITTSKTDDMKQYWQSVYTSVDAGMGEIAETWTGAEKETGMDAKTDTGTLYDTVTDASIDKYVSPTIPFNGMKYAPSDLVNIAGKYVRTLKKWMQLRKEASDNLSLLSQDFYTKFWTPLTVVSAYRSYTYQKWIKDRGCGDNLCAKAGHSEHQTGLALDIFEASTQKGFLSNKKYRKYFEWMQANAHKYGFHNSYRNGISMDGYDPEPWHWRYLWKALAKELYEKNMSFAQYHDAMAQPIVSGAIPVFR